MYSLKNFYNVNKVEMEREVEEGEKRNSNIVSRKWGARGRKRTCSKVTVVGGGGGGGGTY